jgi:hypothetical protein
MSGYMSPLQDWVLQHIAKQYYVQNMQEHIQALFCFCFVFFFCFAWKRAEIIE